MRWTPDESAVEQEYQDPEIRARKKNQVSIHVILIILVLKGVAMQICRPVNIGSIVALLGLWMILSVSNSAHAATQGDVPRISIQELKKMMDDETPVTIIDVQPKDIYEMGHIKGAISLPWKAQIALEDVWSLPNDQPIVTYCDCGPGESDSASVAAQLFQFGFDNVKVLKDPSIRGWKELNYPMEKKQQD
jgi:rhodanese-related sulfurtransferase